MKKLAFVLLLVAGLSLVASAQDKAAFDVSKIPAMGDKPQDFAPSGWKVEETVRGDLNGDGKPDYAIKLIEDKPKSADTEVDRARVLVLGFDDGGKIKRVAVADKLLQCTACGGAFYGVVDAPANVKIEKGVLIVNQDHGSRDVTETTYRFRYDEQPSMFILIGFDYADRDRAEGGTHTESTNYLTGKRVTTTSKGKRDTTKTTIVEKMRYSITEIDAEDFEGKATHRLGLD